jgi:hypothetical protein
VTGLSNPSGLACGHSYAWPIGPKIGLLSCTLLAMGGLCAGAAGIANFASSVSRGRLVRRWQSAGAHARALRFHQRRALRERSRQHQFGGV